MESVRATQQRLREALDRDLAMYEKYVPNKFILAEYLLDTKRALLAAVNDAFDEKIGEILSRD